MRLLANENFPAAAVRSLRDAGHDVVWIRETSPGISDVQVLALAQAELRTLITFDKDFGELAFHSGLSATSGVILFRIRKPSPDVIARRTVEIISARIDWSGHFAVVEEDRIRMTLLPSKPRP